MFTGIIEESGIVAGLKPAKNLATLLVKSGKVSKGLKAGESVAVNGVCLTAAQIKGRIITFHIIQESLYKTTLGSLKSGDKINLEPALKFGSRLGGHFVTGHVDGLGVLARKVLQKNYVEYEIRLARELLRYVVPKGSITIDGVSLTVGKVGKNSFSVYLIPYTLKVTNLGLKKAQDKVNIETDILAKYVRKTRQGRPFLTKNI
jgi:riboflavin synthase